MNRGNGPVKQTPDGTSATALKALRALEIVASSSIPLSVQEVAQRLRSDKSTCYRMLMTLYKAGYVVRQDDSKFFSLSYKVVSLSRNLLAENEVSRLIQQELRALAVVTQETLHYSVLDRMETVLVQRVKGTQLVNVDFQIGDRSPLHCTAIGKAILAFQNVLFVEEVIAAGLPRRTAYTITDPEGLRSELHRVRSMGYAVDDHEFSDTMRCIAVPLFEGGGLVSGGFSISTPDYRMSPDRIEELRDLLLKASRKFSRQLGGMPWQA